MSATAPTPAVALTVEQLWQRVPGGSGTYVTALAAALADRLPVTGLSAWHRARRPSELDPRVPVRRAPLPRRALYEAWQRVGAPRAEHLVPHADVVHATTWAVPPTRRPLVVTVHDVAFLDDPSHFTAHGVAFFRRALTAVVERADAVVVPSQDTAAACRRAGIESSRLHVVPHGTDVRPAAADDVARVRARYALTGTYVLWVGTREPRKNLDVVLRAYERARDRLDGAELVLVGPQGWGEDAAPTGAPGVRVLGAVPRTDLPALYTGARAFCFPSLREGFGLPVLEAMAAGVPVVTSAGTACAEVAGTAGVLVDPLDPDAVAEGLATATGGRHHALAAASLERATAFSWGEAARATTAVYAAVASR
ncbi:glycosyltransferase family 4 protein [Cellulomonas shaoxiangyii]|uniref:Glycosyltransferase family 1 protein n=1 Tax=Cellulomonas shaoxiangyii TaxID=2566013 RepID=A0A4P7SJ72_9CELL|nr:glycosyltransferase family 1 protein [Cellulomonas shaoxiangyii]QCB93146.1 glycosyltransferase family 1 protein [Cellulomonas shaoxiangyii]TGY84805.1 glycosyltransferase family 1 protein [Cellulomonas shaoxiangyii]